MLGLLTTTALAASLLVMKPVADGDSYEPSWEVWPSGHLRVGVGFHPQEPPSTVAALELDLGPEFLYGRSFTLRPALAYGLDLTAARPVEHFGAVGLGIGGRIPMICSFEYMPGFQLGAFRGAPTPAFRHTLSWHMFYYVGLALTHFVTGVEPDIGKPRQAVRIMASVDVARLIAYSI